MTASTAIGKGRLRDRITALENELPFLRSQRGVGVLTTVTPRGVFQSAKPGISGSAASGKPVTTIPRWG